MSSHRLRSTADSAQSPFRYPFGEKLGSGQDNVVRSFDSLDPRAGRLVVKISQQKGNSVPSPERAFESTLYKKKKYEMLKTFLGDFIPDSYFAVGNKRDGLRDPQIIPKSYTLQEKVPDYKISDLTVAQREDPRLLRQMYVLLLKLQNMYGAINQVNTLTGNDALDGKLDLGGISKFAREQYGTGSGFDAAQVVRDFQSSPNLLVNPDTLQLYCVDFDDGTWSPEKEAAKGVLEHVASLPERQRTINLSPFDLPQAS